MFLLVINTYYTGKLINVGYLKQVKDILPSFILSLVMFVAINLTNTLTENLVYQILIGGTIGILIYIGVSYLMKFPELDEVKYLLSRNK